MYVEDRHHGYGMGELEKDVVAESDQHRVEKPLMA
jgi:hypothetical protein